MKKRTYTVQPSTPTQKTTISEADPRHELDRRRRERGDAVEREAHELRRAGTSTCRRSGIARVRDTGLPEADPARHAAEEARAFGHRARGVGGAAREQPEVAGVRRDIRCGECGGASDRTRDRERVASATRPRGRRVSHRRRRSLRASCATSCGITSGGSWRSASISTTASPRAASSPAVSATWWPKLRESFSSRSRGSRAARLGSASQEPSVDPSSTSRISYVAERREGRGEPSPELLDESRCFVEDGATTESTSCHLELKPRPRKGGRPRARLATTAARLVLFERRERERPERVPRPQQARREAERRSRERERARPRARRSGGARGTPREREPARDDCVAVASPSWVSQCTPPSVELWCAPVVARDPVRAVERGRNGGDDERRGDASRPTSARRRAAGASRARAG